jgi:hypothetical protein
MSRKIAVMFILCSVSLLIFLSVDGCYKTKRLKKDGVLSKALVFKIDIRPLKGYCFVSYRYDANGITYTQSKKVGLSNIVKEHLLESEVPLLYDSQDPNNHLALFTKFDYEGTSLKIPASLSWFKY